MIGKICPRTFGSARRITKAANDLDAIGEATDGIQVPPTPSPSALGGLAMSAGNARLSEAWMFDANASGNGTP